MNTLEKAEKPRRFVILIPHRDTERLLHEYRVRLFAAGFAGAYAFPAAAVLAETERPFSRDELKALARNIRSRSGGNDGKILNEGSALVPGPGTTAFFGLLLNIPAGKGLFPETAAGKVLREFLPPVLCAALVKPGENPLSADASVPAGLSGGFRTAALANMSVRPLACGEADYSHEWKIGVPVWLPSHKRN